MNCSRGNSGSVINNPTKKNSGQPMLLQSNFRSQQNMDHMRNIRLCCLPRSAELVTKPIPSKSSDHCILVQNQSPDNRASYFTIHADGSSDVIPWEAARALMDLIKSRSIFAYFETKIHRRSRKDDGPCIDVVARTIRSSGI